MYTGKSTIYNPGVLHIVLEIDTLSEFVSSMSQEKINLVMHILSKNISLKLLKLLADKGDENTDRLLALLEEQKVGS